MPSVRVVAPGLLTSVQDGGRYGYEHLGIMVGGALDDYAAAWANRLLGNSRDAALLEVTMIGPTLEALDEGYLSLAGANLGASVDGEPWPPGSVRRLARGSVVRFGGPRTGARAYIGFHGGLEVPIVLGSRSTDLIAGFGGLEGRPLRTGDVLQYAEGAVQELCASVETRLVRSAVRILPGVRRDRFADAVLDALVAQEYSVSPNSDRVGMRLSGQPVAGAPLGGDAISEGMAIGSVQLPPGGEPLVLLKSRGTIGGYPTLAHIISADLPVLAQLVPGDRVRLEIVDQDEAVRALHALRDMLQVPLLPIRQEEPATDASPVQGTLVQAPSWCTAYRARGPGQPPLVRPGQRVRAGEALAVIEVMKSFSELLSPHDATVVSVQFEDGDVVQEGQALIELIND